MFGRLFSKDKKDKAVICDSDDVASRSGGRITRSEAKALALEQLSARGYDDIPIGYVMHFGPDGNVQIVERNVHTLFTHYSEI